jgi:MFS family permease
MNATSTGKTPAITWQAFGFLWLVWACNGISREAINRVSPLIIDTFNLTGAQLGTVLSLGSLAMALGAIPLASWADKAGVAHNRKKRSFILGLAYLIPLFICGYIGMYAIGLGFGVFAFFFIIRGFGNASGESCEVGQMMEWAPREKQGFFVGIHHTGYPWGCFLSGLGITAMLMAFGNEAWGLSFMAVAIIGVIGWLFWLRYATKERYERFEEQCRENGLTPPLEGYEEIDDSKLKIGTLIKNPNVLMGAVGCFVNMFAYAGVGFWLTPYVTFIGNYDVAAAASLGVVFTITGGLGQIVWGWLSDKFGTKRMLIVCVLWLAISFALLKWAYVGLFALIGLQLLFGCVINAIFILWFKLSSVSVGPGGAVKSNSILTTGMYLGGIVATIVIGWAIDVGGGWEAISGYNTGLLFIVAANVICLALVFLFTREINGSGYGKDFSVVSMEACNLDK